MSASKHPQHTPQEERQAEHIAETYRQHGTSEATAEHRAWATVNRRSKDPAPESPGGEAEGKAEEKAKGKKGRRIPQH